MQSDDSARFNALIVPQLNAAYNLARYLMRDATHAEDVVQDAYVRAFTAFGQFRGGDAKAWLLAVVRNCCLTALSKQTDDRTKFIETADLPANAVEIDSVTPESAALNDEASATLRRLVADLPASMREVLVLREFEELSYREIAVIIDAPIGTVMSRLARARAQLDAEYRRLHLSEVRS